MAPLSIIYVLSSNIMVYSLKIPFFKSGKSSVRNNRPMSLLPVVSKVLEKLIYNDIVDFVTSSITVHQFGFLRGRSTTTAACIFHIFSTPPCLKQMWCI